MPINEIRKLKGMDYAIDGEVADKEIKVKVPKAPKAINKRSEKQKDVIKELKKMYPIFLTHRPDCEIQGPGCLIKATCVHHSEGRLPSKVLDSTKWFASCEPCNLWCETHHAEAKKLGFKKSKF